MQSVKSTIIRIELMSSGNIDVKLMGDHAVLSEMVFAVMTKYPQNAPVFLGAVIEWAKRNNINLADLAQANDNISKQ